MNPDLTTIPDWDGLIVDPGATGLAELTSKLALFDGPADEEGSWPGQLWSILTEARVPFWSLPPEHGGEGCVRERLLARYARVAEGSLTAAFILSQHDAAVRRLAAAGDRACAQGWLRRIARGEAFATVGISHLTTSRRLGDRPMSAIAEGRGYRFAGVMPWVTSAERADVIVTGAPLDDGRQILAALPTDREGVTIAPAFRLAALQASCTTEVICDLVLLNEDEVLVGPAVDVMAHPGAAGTGGLETTALALGLARAALVAMAVEARHKESLREPLAALVEEWREAWNVLVEASRGLVGGPNPGQARALANGHVLRVTQAFLTVRKGTGFLRAEPAQRWAREALFFLVWSCPTPVAQAAIRDLAGLCPA